MRCDPLQLCVCVCQIFFKCLRVLFCSASDHLDGTGACTIDKETPELLPVISNERATVVRMWCGGRRKCRQLTRVPLTLPPAFGALLVCAPFAIPMPHFFLRLKPPCGWTPYINLTPFLLCAVHSNPAATCTRLRKLYEQRLIKLAQHPPFSPGSCSTWPAIRIRASTRRTVPTRSSPRNRRGTARTASRHPRSPRLCISKHPSRRPQRW